MEITRPDGFKYDITTPKERLDAAIVWRLGDDPYSSVIVSRLGIGRFDADVELAHRIVNRETQSLGKIDVISGRSAIVRSGSEYVLNEPYNALEIGGFGFQQMKISGSHATIDPSEPIGIPSSDNFAKRFSSITQTGVLNANGRFETLQDKFSFMGAYTWRQAATKVANNLFILDGLSQKFAQGERVDMIVPLPVAVGKYPHIKDAQGQSAFFMVWKVPYEGKRTGNAPLMTYDQIAQHAHSMIEIFPRMAEGTRYFHDVFGVTHNQLTPGNVYVPENMNKPVYIADFATLYPFTRKDPTLSRAHDVSHGIENLTLNLKSLVRINEPAKLMEYLFLNSLVAYGLEQVVNGLGMTRFMPRRSLIESFYLYMKTAEASGTLRGPSNAPEDIGDSLSDLQEYFRGGFSQS
jgi:hypothetical protein